MLSKILPSGGEAVVESPTWQQSESSALKQVRQDGESDELTHLRQRLATVEAGVPTLVEQARADGRRIAELEAVQRAEQARDEVSRRMAGNAHDFVTLRFHMRRQMEEDLVRLAVAVARRIVRRELAVDPSALTGIARAAIDQLEAREIYRIRVAPRDTELIRKFVADSGLPSQIQVLPDAALETGSMVIETVHGTMDASVGVQLDEIDRGLADVVRRSQ